MVIELSAVDAASPFARTLLTACNEGLGGGCVTSRPPEGSVQVVRLRWDAAQRRAHVEVIDADARETQARDLTFTEHDEPSERWRAVGLVIAAVVGEASSTDRNTLSPPASPPPAVDRLAAGERSETGAAGDRRAAWPRWHFDGGFTTGPGLDTEAWRRGGWARGSAFLFGSPVFVSLHARYTVRPGDVTVAWLSGGLAVGLAWTPRASRFGLETHADVVGLWLRASTTETATGESDRASQSGLGARLGVDGIWNVAPPLGLVLGVEGAATRAATVIRVHEQLAGKDPTFRLAVLAGLRFAPGW